MNRLVGLLRMLWDSTDRYRAQYYAHDAHLRRVRDEHRAIIAAVADGDAEEAVRLLAVHRGHAVDTVRRMLDGEATTRPR
jgi:DNA-binding GntR family transcriptional regulator